ncbi:hypothetical protein CTEN210_12527 [Chaetoceros tenuissimus]|uniref:Leucine-rich repeat domain-containing protein n=1 Tax=Chaetoceros tenuissimus TaxID=426638 RepID=A0AAD3D1C8_9STRA|nr:hypothetical protein CTEN210_12527 [Chaetoceros tenuissimus]
MRVDIVNGLKTLFYDGRELYNHHLDQDAMFLKESERSEECLAYHRERESWEQIIVLDGVIEIVSWAFKGCKNIQKVILADSVMRIEGTAFYDCFKLAFIKWSRNLEYIGNVAFFNCFALEAVYLPPSCREVDHGAFIGCKNLIIFVVGQNTQLGEEALVGTKILKKSPFETAQFGIYNNEEVHTWVRNLNTSPEFELHGVCSSFEPLDLHDFYLLLKQSGLNSMNVPNDIGVTPSEYLNRNPYAKIKESQLAKYYVLQLMGEVV